MSESTLDQVAAALGAADSVLFITGAGMSADSGLPTYRGIGGLYNRDTEEGMPIEVALSGEVFRTRPEITWRYLHELRAAAAGAEPNEGHRVLARLEQRLPRVCVLTQNVDGFHVRAGSRNVIAIHGRGGTLICTSCEWRTQGSEGQELPALPRCPDCGSVARPEVVLFGEWLPPAALETYRTEMALGFDLVISVGTTSVFPYIAAPVLIGAEEGAGTVEINPDDTEVSHAVRWRLRMGAAEALVALEERLGPG